MIRASLALVLVLAIAFPVRAQNVNVTTSVLQQYVDGIEALLTSVEGDTTAMQTALQLLDNAAGITPADNFANPTGALVVYALTGCWDGTTWDRCTGSAADTELPTAATLADNTSNPSLPAIAAYMMCFDGTTWDRCGVDGASVHYRTSAGATEDEHEIKATAGTLYSVLITNTNASARYIRCYNLTAANTTPGTSTVLWGAAVPSSGFTATFPAGLTFTTALTCAWTTGAADTDVVEVAANDLKATYTYR